MVRFDVILLTVVSLCFAAYVGGAVVAPHVVGLLDRVARVVG